MEHIFPLFVGWLQHNWVTRFFEEVYIKAKAIALGHGAIKTKLIKRGGRSSNVV